MSEPQFRWYIWGVFIGMALGLFFGWGLTDASYRAVLDVQNSHPHGSKLND